MVWNISCVISILEEKYGLGALEKNKDLIKGNNITTLVLDIDNIYHILEYLPETYVSFLVNHEERKSLGKTPIFIPF